jgi:chemotaxis protein MotB
MLSTARAVVLPFLLLSFVSCVAPERHRQVLAQRDRLEAQKVDRERYLLALEGKIAGLEAEIARLVPLARDASYIQDQRQRLDDILARLKGSGGQPLPGVESISTPEGPALRVEGQVLFPSGSNVLSAEGEGTLGQLVEAIASHAGKVRVSGHTDSDPISASSWRDNMQLSAERAMSVRAFLVKSGVPADKLSIAGYGEFAPVDPGEKSRNRRVEIVLLN